MAAVVVVHYAGGAMVMLFLFSLFSATLSTHPPTRSVSPSVGPPGRRRRTVACVACVGHSFLLVLDGGASSSRPAFGKVLSWRMKKRKAIGTTRFRNIGYLLYFVHP